MRRRWVRRSFAIAAVVGVGAWSAACGSSADPASLFSPEPDAAAPRPDGTGGGQLFEDGSGGGGSGGASGGNTSGGVGDAGPRTDGNDFIFDSAPIDVVIPDAPFVYEPPVRDAAINADSACAATRVEATLRPLDMFIMLDKSGSMGADCNYSASGTPAAASKWCRSVQALGGYFYSAANDPGLQGNRVALQYFPTPASTPWTCTARAATDTASLAHSSKLAFGWRSLSLATANSLVTSTTASDRSLNTESPNGDGTPSQHALNGIYGFYDVATNRDANRAQIALFITDGDPNGCPVNDATGLSDILQSMFTTHGIRTYVIGMTGATFSRIEQIAAGGNAAVHANTATTPCGTGNTCRHYSVGDGNPQVFLDVLGAIQRNAIGCSYDMPKTDAGIVNPSRISVEYRLTAGGAAVPVPKVNTAADCTASGGYYFDDNLAPTKVNLCPTTCGVVQGTSTAKVEVLVACLGS